LDLIFRDLYEEEIHRKKPNIAAELTASVNAELKKENMFKNQEK